MTPHELSAALTAAWLEVMPGSDPEETGRRIAAAWRPARSGGDWATPIALTARGDHGHAGVAHALAERLRERPGIEAVHVQGAGVLTITLSDPAAALTWILDSPRIAGSNLLSGAVPVRVVADPPSGRSDALRDTLTRLIEAAGGTPDETAPGSCVRVAQSTLSRPEPEFARSGAVRYHQLRTPAAEPLDLDVEAAVRRVPANPWHLVCHAHARAAGVVRRDARPANIVLARPQETSLASVLADLPRVVAAAAAHQDVVRLTRYLESTSNAFHDWYETPSDAREPLAAATARVLHAGLTLLGVPAPDRH
ncbi:MAG: DALR anticodon-binding domain-containing protein [Mobilicoccus sp.]|nr:DALR anticodon-binding domain-containing protein [Mobilicoccus sp.]